MAQRKPLIVDQGRLKELPSGDSLDPATVGAGTRTGGKFLRDDGTWADPPAGGSSSSSSIGLSIAINSFMLMN